MKIDLKDKRLLIIGANPETSQIVKTANELGVFTIVTSFRKDDEAKKYACKVYDVDGMDVDSLSKIVKNEHIDGILVGVADMLVPYYYELCKEVNLPCYATFQAINTFCYKDNFKRNCEKYGLKGIKEYTLDQSLKKEEVSRIEFPVMIKPVDNASGTGMTVCYKESELKNAVKKALSCSKNKRFIVEKYMECDDFAVYYTFSNGQCSLSCAFDRYTDGSQKGLARVNTGSLYPSKHLGEYLEKINPKVKRMIKDMGIKNGVLLMQAFYEDGDFFFYDPGFRLQGEGCHFLLKAINGYDQRQMLINFALTGSMGNVDLEKEDDPYFGGKAASTLWFLLKEGRISKLEGLDALKDDPRIILNFQRFNEGDIVKKEWIGTEKQVLTRLFIVCDNKLELAKAISEYRSTIKAFDSDGNNMLLDGFDPYIELGVEEK